MSNDFEEVIREQERLDKVKEKSESENYVQPETAEYMDRDVDLREEVSSQIKLLRQVKHHLFFANGAPRNDTETADITAYMNSSIKLLNMLRNFDDALKTDDDLRKIEAAIDMALEDCPCPDFIVALTDYLVPETS